jgi:hypothetical protein
MIENLAFMPRCGDVALLVEGLQTLEDFQPIETEPTCNLFRCAWATT